MQEHRGLGKYRVMAAEHNMILKPTCLFELAGTFRDGGETEVVRIATATISVA